MVAALSNNRSAARDLEDRAAAERTGMIGSPYEECLRVHAARACFLAMIPAIPAKIGIAMG